MASENRSISLNLSIIDTILFNDATRIPADTKLVQLSTSSSYVSIIRPTSNATNLANFLVSIIRHRFDLQQGNVLGSTKLYRGQASAVVGGIAKGWKPRSLWVNVRSYQFFSRHKVRDSIKRWASRSKVGRKPLQQRAFLFENRRGRRWKGARRVPTYTRPEEEAVEEKEREKEKEEGERGRGRERKREREKGRKRSRPIRTPNQGDTRLIRRSQLVEAVQTGIHIRYGLGYRYSPVHPHPLHRLPDTDTNVPTVDRSRPIYAPFAFDSLQFRFLTNTVLADRGHCHITNTPVMRPVYAWLMFENVHTRVPGSITLEISRAGELIRSPVPFLVPRSKSRGKGDISLLTSILQIVF